MNSDRTWKCKSLLAFVECVLVFWAAQGISATASAQIMFQYTNDSSVGTSTNKLAKISSGKAVTSAVSDLTGLVGIVVAGAGTSGASAIAAQGLASCVFDGSTTTDDYVTASTSLAGACHDSGSTFPGKGQVLGRVLSTNAGAGTYQVMLLGGEVHAPAFIFTGNCTGCTIAAASTKYLVFGAAGSSSTETNQQVVVTRSGVLANFYFVTGGANSLGAGNTLTCKVRKNAANTGLQIISSNGDPAQVYSDVTNSATVNPGDLIDIQCVNSSAGTASPVVKAYSVEVQSL